MERAAGQGEALVATAADLARAHYRGYLEAGRPSLPVAEWGRTEENPLVVYWKPFTLADHAKVFGGERRVDARSYAEVLFNKAEDARGERLFSDMRDIHVLKYEADQSVVRRVADAIMAAPTLSDQRRRLQEDDLRMTMHVLADKMNRTIGEIEQMSVAEFRETLAYYQLKKDR